MRRQKRKKKRRWKTKSEIKTAAKSRATASKSRAEAASRGVLMTDRSAATEASVNDIEEPSFEKGGSLLRSVSSTK